MLLLFFYELFCLNILLNGETFGHITRYDILCKITMQGSIESGRRRGHILKRNLVRQCQKMYIYNYTRIVNGCL